MTFKKNDKNKESSCTDLINIADIKGNFLYTKDNKIFSYLLLQPIPVALMTETEKIAFTQSLKRELSPIELPFKLFLISRATDVRRNIEYLESVKGNETDSIKRELLTDNIKFLASMSSNAGVLERQAFFCIWITRTDIHDESYLLDKMHEYSKAFTACKVQNTLLSEKEIIRVCHMTLNPLDTSVVIQTGSSMPIFDEGEDVHG